MRKRETKNGDGGGGEVVVQVERNRAGRQGGAERSEAG